MSRNFPLEHARLDLQLAEVDLHEAEDRLVRMQGCGSAVPEESMIQARVRVDRCRLLVAKARLVVEEREEV